jgi:hypothetical protein
MMGPADLAATYAHYAYMAVLAAASQIHIAKEKAAKKTAQRELIDTWRDKCCIRRDSQG